MTTERLKRNMSVLELLKKAAINQRKAIIDTSTKDQLMCICDCATSNILHENTLTALSLQTFHVLHGVNAYVKHELTDLTCPACYFTLSIKVAFRYHKHPAHILYTFACYHFA